MLGYGLPSENRNSTANATNGKKPATPMSQQLAAWPHPKRDGCSGQTPPHRAASSGLGRLRSPRSRPAAGMGTEKSWWAGKEGRQCRPPAASWPGKGAAAGQLLVVKPLPALLPPPPLPPPRRPGIRQGVTAGEWGSRWRGERRPAARGASASAGLAALPDLMSGKQSSGLRGLRGLSQCHRAVLLIFFACPARRADPRAS